MRARLIVMLVMWLAAVTPARAWQLAERGETRRVILDGAGAVYAFGDLYTAYAGQPVTFIGGLVKLDAATGTELWRYLEPNPSYASAVAVRPGMVVVSMASYGAIRLDADTGMELWRWEPGPGLGTTLESLIDPAGDVILVSGVGSGPDLFAVTKLAGATGAVVWQYTADGSSSDPFRNSFARAVTVDTDGDVIAAGVFDNLLSEDLGVVKLSGETGAELWRADIDGTSGRDFAYDVIADAAGDVMVTGFIDYPSVTATVVKLSRDDGSELWRDAPPPGVEFRAVVALDSMGNLMVGGSDVAKLDPATGATLWSVPVPPAPDAFSLALVVAPDDDVLAAFYSVGPPGAPPTFARLAGTDGTMIWSRSVLSPVSGGTGEGVDVALAPDGTVFGATQFDFLVLAMREELSGHKLSYRDAEPAKLSVVSKDALMFAPTPEEANDPSLFGATLDLVNPDTSEAISVFLPPSGWTSAVSRNGNVRWKYADPTGVCRRVLLKSTGKLVAKCVGPLGFSLDEPSQGRMAVALRFAGGHRHCLDFSSGIVIDQPGKFVATGAPAPTVCPIP